MKGQERLDVEVLGSYLRARKFQNSSKGFSPNGVWSRRKAKQKVDLFILEGDSFRRRLVEQVDLALKERYPAIDDLVSVLVGETAMALVFGRIGFGGSENSAEQRQKARDNDELHDFDDWIWMEV